MRALLLVLVAACGGGASMQSVKVTNSSSHKIAELYLYPLGAPNHGVSRGILAPGATLLLQIKAGNVEVEAISELIEIDTHTRDKRTASSAIELKSPAEVVFFDTGAKPAMAPSVIGVEFQPRGGPNNPAPVPTAPPPPSDN